MNENTQAERRTTRRLQTLDVQLNSTRLTQATVFHHLCRDQHESPHFLQFFILSVFSVSSTFHFLIFSFFSFFHLPCSPRFHFSNFFIFLHFFFVPFFHFCIFFIVSIVYIFSSFSFFFFHFHFSFFLCFIFSFALFSMFSFFIVSTATRFRVAALASCSQPPCQPLGGSDTCTMKRAVPTKQTPT